MARLRNHSKEEVRLDTEAHHQEQPEKDAVGELGDHSPLRLRATEVEVFQGRRHRLTPTQRRLPRRRGSSAAPRRTSTATQAAAAARSADTIPVVGSIGFLGNVEMRWSQLERVRPRRRRIGGAALDDRRQLTGATVAGRRQVVRRVEARREAYGPLRTAVWRVLLGVDVRHDDGHDKCDRHHDHRRRKEHP